MNLFSLLLIALVALALAYLVRALVSLVSSDGAGLRRSDPPRSHPRDLFDPRSRAA